MGRVSKQETSVDERQGEAKRPRMASRERALAEAAEVAKRDKKLLERLAK